jgi:hypothetical protein
MNRLLSCTGIGERAELIFVMIWAKAAFMEPDEY